MKSLVSLKDIDSKKTIELIDKAIDMKKNPSKYAKEMAGKTLLMIFEKPSLRTRLSFEVAMTSMGGNAIVVETGNTPLGKKETIEDTAKCASRYVNGIMARLFSHEAIVSLASNASVPVINGLTNDEHPCQVLGDLQTIFEKKGKLKGLKICYLGDGNNNVLHSMIIGCALTGVDISIGCPKEFMPNKEIINYASKISKINIEVTNDAKKAVSGADVVYTDSWMSYHIKPEEEGKRKKILMPFQVNKEIIKYAKKDYLFMHCLPATRGYEMTAEIIDGPNSVVFDQAENRLHIQKAVILDLMK